MYFGPSVKDKVFDCSENVTATEDVVVVVHADGDHLCAAVHLQPLRRQQLWRGLRVLRPIGRGADAEVKAHLHTLFTHAFSTLPCILKELILVRSTMISSLKSTAMWKSLRILFLSMNLSFYQL